MNKYCITSLACFILSSVSLQAVKADIEEIIVTADLRQSEESDVSSSISILGAKRLAAMSAQHFDDVIGKIPNLNYASGTSRSRFFQIRGIGERSQFASPINPSVGFVIDNVDFTGLGSAATLLDIQQVEVLRGPQGTQYGANALAGLINLKSHDPTYEQTVKLKLGAGQFGNRTISMTLNKPLNDKVSSRFAIEKHRSDGYYKNAFLKRDDTNQRNELSMRGKIKVEVSDLWQLNISLSKIDVNNGYDTFSLDNTRTTLSDQPGKDTQDTTSLSIQNDWQYEIANVQLTLAAGDSALSYSYDEDWTFVGFHPFGYSSFDRYNRNKKIRSAELRVISNPSSKLFGDSTDWVVGGYFLYSNEKLDRQYTFLANNFRSENQFSTNALFGQLDTRLNEDWVLSTGLRIEERRTKYGDSDLLKFQPKETLWGGRIAIKHYAENDAMTYLSLARGYKSGGFNIDGSLPKNLREFNSEFLWELEAGIKSTVLAGTVIIRGAIFYDIRRDQQVKSAKLTTRANGSTEFVDFLGNAAEGTNYGLEFESRWFLSETFSMNLALGLLNATFDEFINEFGDNLAGRKQSQAPTYNYDLGFNWQQNAWSASISINGKDRFFFSDRHALQSTQYNLIGGNITYKKNKYSANFWARNLTNKDYTVRGFGSFGNDPRDNYTTRPFTQFGEPRIIGLTISFETGL